MATERLARKQLATTEQRLQFAELKIQVLEERLRRKLIEKYGPGSEKLSAAQLELLEREPGVSNVEVQAESEREPLARKPRRPKHPGRQTLPPLCPVRADGIRGETGNARPLFC